MSGRTSVVVLKSDDAAWGEALRESAMGDVYFSAEYHRIFEEYEGHEAELFIFRDGDRSVAYPYMRRDLAEIEHLGLGRGQLYDVSSAYGYGGPFWGKDEPDEETWRAFTEAFGEHCRSEGIVSEFARFHPLAGNHAGYPDAEERNRTVYVDLTLSEEEMWGAFSSANRRSIRKAERGGVRFEELPWGERGEEFCRLYEETMRRVGAGDFYFFPMSFFESHFRHLGEGARLFGAMVEDELAAAALCMGYGRFFHYHFGCSSERHLALRPNNLLFWGMIKWARERGYRMLHLGGGYEVRDSLYRFKESFSRKTAPFLVAKRIHCTAEYERLSKLNEKRIAGEGRKLSAREMEFFPAYRR